ncbi:NAD(P)/FAD-dependent oxidoreductase [Nocardiopsis sp. CNS-639]|uniref:FAD-dependent oxidoreductase n=1 Tax=Nocardiopsis sp. CNS-639 TaxID=1169153 RepID=UPI0012DBE57E|nr:NAD(P)/FAD-dependent oxidoreductase [Nocardiopsis sp. CNS-639]
MGPRADSVAGGRRALVVGGGIAGSAAAWWLHHTGWDVVLVDASSTPHVGGFVLDLDTTAQEILRAMDAEDIITRTSATSPATAFRLTRGPRPCKVTFVGGKARLSHRVKLIEELLQHVPEEVDVRLGVRLETLEHRAEDVQARFDDGSAEPFDIVVGADGLHSTVRNLALSPQETSLYRNGLSLLWTTVNRPLPGADGLVVSRNRTVVFAYPYPDTDKTQIIAALPTPRPVTDTRPLAEQVAAVLHEMGGDLTPIAEGVLEAEDTLLTRFTQVRAPRWSSGRVVLLGDAAHCIDPLSGLGAHGALLGAVTLAKALQRHGEDTTAAFASYEAHVRPFVQASQHTTARAVEYATRPESKSRWATLLGGAGELVRTLPQALSAPGRRALNGTVDLSTVHRVRS